MSITLLLTTSTNSQQVNTLAEEFLDYNEDEANLNISLEVVDIEEIIDDLKSVDNEEDLYSPPPIPLITTAQARSHLTELVQYLEALSVSELPSGAMKVVVARQQLSKLLLPICMHLVFRALLQIGFTTGVLLSSVIAFLSCCVRVLLGYYAVVTPPI